MESFFLLFDRLLKQGNWSDPKTIITILAIIVNLDVMLAKRKMKLRDLVEVIGITVQNLSILKTGKAKAICFSTLISICDHLDCQPGDILEFRIATIGEFKDFYNFWADTRSIIACQKSHNITPEMV